MTATPNDAGRPVRVPVSEMDARDMLMELVEFARSTEDAFRELAKNPMLKAMIPQPTKPPTFH
jgi:hypothetical protein